MPVPPPGHPVLGIGHPPRPARPLGGDGGQVRIVNPCDVGAHVLHSIREERPALAPSERSHARCRAVGIVCKVDRAAQQIEVKPRPGIEPAQHPLPAVDHPIQLFGSLAVQDAGRHPPDAHKFSRPRQARSPIFQPAPPGQFLGQRSRRVVVHEFVVHVHALSPNQRSSREPPPICRDRSGRGTCADARRISSMLGSCFQAQNPTP